MAEEIQSLREETNEEFSEKHTPCPAIWKFSVVVLLVCALFLTGVFIGYMITRFGAEQEDRINCGQNGKGQTGNVFDASKPFGHGNSLDPRELERIHWKLFDYLGSQDYVLPEELIDFSTVAVPSGSRHDHELYGNIHENLAALGLDDVSSESYSVLLSFPDSQKPNFVRIYQGNKTEAVAFEGVGGGTKYSRSSSGFVAYSPSADVMAELINLNYGSEKDFNAWGHYNFTGKLALMKMGYLSLEDKVSAASRHHLAGLLLYADEEAPDNRHQKCSTKAPHAVIRTAGGGDPITVGFPAIEGAWHMKPDCAKVPTIPVRTLSCHSVRTILPYLQTANSTNHQPMMVHLVVNSKLVTKSIRNIVATIFGDKDPDHMIVVGASRNGPEAGDGVNGTTVLLQLADGLAKMLHNRSDEWIPKRTIRLISWGGADVNDIGMVEFLEKYIEVWQNKVIAYIDLDRSFKIQKNDKVALDDDASVVLSATSSLDKLLEILVEQVKDRDSTLPSLVSRHGEQLPVGYQYGLTKHPFRRLFGSAYFHMETAMVSPFSDEDDESGALLNVVCRLVGLVTVTLADSGILPLQLQRTVDDLTGVIDDLIASIGSLMPNATIEAFYSANQQLKKSVDALDLYVAHHLQFEHPEDIRTVNSVIVHFESLIGRLLGRAVDLVRYSRLHSANNDSTDIASHLATAGCSEGLVSSSGTLLSEEVSVLLTRMSAASRVISLTG